MNWFLLAFIAPILWAIVALIDTYFVKDVYEDEYDGAIISGVFQSVPWLFVLLGVIDFVPLGGTQTVLAVMSGVFFLFSFFYYFKALFISNDGAFMQILWGLSVPMVPFIAWLLIDETLLPIHYSGIALAFLGVVVFGLDGSVVHKELLKIFFLMFRAVVLFSLSMVLSKEVYQSTPYFWSVFLLFSSGGFIAAVVLLFTDKKKIWVRAKKIINLSDKYFLAFLFSESLSIIGTLTSQRAISLTPSVSFVVTIESLVPVFVMLLSLVLVLFFKQRGRSDIELAYRKQFSQPLIKSISMTLIAAGIYLIS